MRSPAVDFEYLLRQLNSLAEGTYEDPSTQDYPRYLGFLDLALGEVWNSEWWFDIMETEERYFRDLYSASTTYNKKNEVYFPSTQKYYQCLRDATLGQAPATGSPLAENSAYWAESKTSYPSTAWASGVPYAVGDKVSYAVTNRFYQCHTAHTSSGVLTPDATGANERWGELTRFNRYVGWDQTGKTKIGDCFDVKDDDPWINPRWRSYSWGESKDGVQVLEEATYVWLQFRRRRPNLKGQLWDVTRLYVLGDQIYFVPTGGVGNLYEAVANQGFAGRDPVNYPAIWQKVEIPQMFANYLIWAAYAKSLAADGKHSSVPGAQQMAGDYLELETDRIYRQSGQSPGLPMRTYPTSN